MYRECLIPRSIKPSPCRMELNKVSDLPPEQLMSNPPSRLLHFLQLLLLHVPQSVVVSSCSCLQYTPLPLDLRPVFHVLSSSLANLRLDFPRSLGRNLSACLILMIRPPP